VGRAPGGFCLCRLARLVSACLPTSRYIARSADL
jgi:hypothetical protein